MPGGPKRDQVIDLLGRDHELFVEIVVGDRAAELRLRITHTVHLDTHAVRLGQMGDLQGAGEPALKFGFMRTMSSAPIWIQVAAFQWQPSEVSAASTGMSRASHSLR